MNKPWQRELSDNKFLVHLGLSSNVTSSMIFYHCHLSRTHASPSFLHCIYHFLTFAHLWIHSLVFPISLQKWKIEEIMPLYCGPIILPISIGYARNWDVKWSESCWAVSGSLWPRGLYSPWNPPSQNTGVGSLSLLCGSSQHRDRTQVSRIAGRFFSSWATREAGRVALKALLEYRHLMRASYSHYHT